MRIVTPVSVGDRDALGHAVHEGLERAAPLLGGREGRLRASPACLCSVMSWHTPMTRTGRPRASQATSPHE